jgi:menaquinol-cytochrome c reductase cytochrome b/c subunit
MKSLKDLQKKFYDTEYKKMKEKGAAFHPFTTWKDVVVAALLLVVLIALSATRGVHMDPPADPTVAGYLPRPEWYFMFLFQLLKYFPGPWAIFAVAIIPGVVTAAIVMLPFYDRNPYRQISKRPVALASGLGLIAALTFLTGAAYWEDAMHPHSPSSASHAVVASAGGAHAEGGKIYSANCAMCHGPNGDMQAIVQLFSKASLAKRDVKKILIAGKMAKGMPSFKDKLSSKEMDELVAYLKETAK